MFSSKKKNQEKAEKASVSQTEIRQVFPGNQLTVHAIQSTFQQRSHSVSYYEVKQGSPSSSITSLQALRRSIQEVPSTSDLKKSSSVSNVPQIKLDAQPIIPSPSGINLNYRSPFSNSPVYSSYGGGRITTPSQAPPSVTANKTTPAVKAPSLKKLVVKKTGKFYDNDDGGVPTYKTSSKNRGEVLMINNIMFEGVDERKGAKIDHERLKDVFEQIGFKVTLKKDLKGKAMKEQIETFSKKNSLKTADISVVVVMSHGTKSSHSGGGTEVFGVDNEGVLVEDILHNFSGDKCKSMAGKPKIFIFQCCRGDDEQFIQSDARPIKPRPLADMLIAYSTLPGFVSYRDPVMGTWYIQTICDVFSEHAHEYHVEELLKIVDMELANLPYNVLQTSSYESRGFKRCYLHPK